LVQKRPHILFYGIFTVLSHNQPDAWKVLNKGKVGHLALWISD